MAMYFLLTAALCAAVRGAPPAPPRLYQQHAPAHLQSIPLDYYMDNSEVAQYYQHQAQQKQGSLHAHAQAQRQQGAPSRLESLEPDSEVELLPGAQQPQQPSQQAPVNPNLPGLVPGQRVFIVHMPVPGYRPGTIGGYQPVYIVAAGAQGNAGYPANGYQNAIILSPGGQGYLSPFLGYPGAGSAQGGHAGGLLVGAGGPFQRPYEQVYQEPTFAYQSVPAPGLQGGARPLHLTQLVHLQGQPGQPDAPRPSAQEAASTSERKRVGEADASEESKDPSAEPRRNARPAPAHAQARNKV